MVHMNKEIEELETRFNDRLDSQRNRERIISVVCDSEKVNDKVVEICESMLKDFEKDVKIKD